MVIWTFLLIPTAAWGSRPPTQTPEQMKVREKWAAAAPKLASDARPKLVAELDSTDFRKAISSIGHIAQKSTDDLLNMMDYEVFVAAHIHNLPIGTVLSMAEQNVTVGVDFPTVMANGYIPTIWELIANGSATYDDKKARGLDKCEVQVLGFSEITLPKPTMAQAWNRPVYNAINLWKRSGGNFEYGEVAFIVNEVDNSNKSFWSPVDTGWYCFGCLFHSNLTTRDDCQAWDHTSFGTHTAWYHLIHPHLKFWGYRLSDLFLRWYGGFTAYPVTNEHLYLEAELSAAFLVPETLKYICLQFKLFSSTPGNKIQQYARYTLHRPLVWAKDYNSKMVLDPWVDGIDGTYKPQDKDRTEFWKLWDANATFGDVIADSNDLLHLHYIDALTQTACDPTKCVHCRFVGVNSASQCMFYK